MLATGPRVPAHGAPPTTSVFVDADGPRRKDVELTRVAGHGWRLSDGRLPAGDPFRMLGTVERTGDDSVVLQLGARFERHRAASVEEAIELVLRTATAMARARLAGDLAWIP